MRDALIAQTRGECLTPMPMHLDIAAVSGEAHIKCSYRKGGRHYACKVASSFPQCASPGNGVMMLFSAETGAPVAILADEGHLTDVRTAAVTAMVVLELKRSDRMLGIIGTGIQARLQAILHAAVLELDEIAIWGRRPEAAENCAADLRQSLPGIRIVTSTTANEVAQRAKLIVTCTAARSPLLKAADLQPGTHISAVGSDSPDKQELETRILESAALILVDSRAQCERLGELKYALHLAPKAIEIGTFCLNPTPFDANGISVCDFTGLGVEDLYIAEYCFNQYENRTV